MLFTKPPPHAEPSRVASNSTLDSNLNDSPQQREVTNIYFDNEFGNGDDNEYVIDLLDYQVLIEAYKFLLRNHRRNRPRNPTSISNRRLGNDVGLSSVSSHSHSSNDETREDKNAGKGSAYSRDNTTISYKHKQAILTLVEIDERSKRVIRILPEFFPSNTRLLPRCLNRLECLETLSLHRCRELTCLPASMVFPRLKKCSINISNFQEPIPASFGNHTQLRSLVVKGTSSGCLDDVQLLFPSSMAKLKNLRHLETHVRNLLQIPTRVLDVWSTSLESMVTIHDLSSSSKNNDNSIKTKRNASNNSLQSLNSTNSDGFVRCRSISTDTFSSEEDFYHLLESSDDEVEEDNGFSLLKNVNIFKEALENQLEVRVFRTIASFSNLKSLKLVYDDAKYKTDIVSIKNRLQNRRKNRRKKKKNNDSNSSNTSDKKNPRETPYAIPLPLLADGPLSLSLQTLDIRTTAAGKKKSSRIPIEISWIDILQDFPLLQTLKLQDCKCSFSSKATKSNNNSSHNKNNAMNESILWMPELRHLFLDKCPDFCIVETTTEAHEQDEHKDDDSDDEIVFCEIPGSANDSATSDNNEDDNGADYFQPIHDDDVDAMMEDNPEEISRIIRLSGLLADTVLAPRDKRQREPMVFDEAEQAKLSDLCTHFLRHCTKLETLSMTDCKIPYLCEDLVMCLPRDSLQEITMDVLDGDANNTSCHLGALLDAHPSLETLKGIGLEEAFAKSDLQRLQMRNQQQCPSGCEQKGRDTTPVSSPIPWSLFWGKSSPTEDSSNTKDQKLLEINFTSIEKDATPSPDHSDTENRDQPVFRLPWPVAALESKLLSSKSNPNNSSSSSGAKRGLLQSIQRTNSRDLHTWL